MNSYNLHTKCYYFDINLGGDNMAGNYFQPFSLRISEELMGKIKYIASNNKRSANKEIEFILEQAVKNYEKENGKIEL